MFKLITNKIENLFFLSANNNEFPIRKFFTEKIQL